MTIPEAAQLVLQAGAMGEGGEIFVLDMGRLVRIVDLAHDMIRLSVGIEDAGDLAVVSGVDERQQLDVPEIRIVTLEGDQTTVYRGGASPRYVDSGHLLFARDETIFGIPLDLETKETTGLAIPLVSGVWTSVDDQENDDGSAQYALDHAGNLLYIDQGAREGEVALRQHDDRDPRLGGFAVDIGHRFGNGHSGDGGRQNGIRFDS